MKKILTAFSVATVVLSCTDSRNEQKTLAAVVKQIPSPASDSCAEPFLFTDKNGLVYLSWTEKKGKKSTLKFSVLENDKWSAPVIIASGNNWFVNWADYPVIATDGNNNLLAHYLEKSDTAKFTYDIKITSSDDAGQSWGPSSVLHNDSVKAEHGFVSIATVNNGFFASWLDGRKTAMQGMEGHDGHHGEMTLRGAMLDAKGNKTNEWELDERVCDCCQTSVAVTETGPVVVYRDRSADEIRDISVVRLINGSWTKPKAIYADNWNIKGCPVNGPQIYAIGNNLAVAWFSMKDKTGEVKIVFSKDGGETFGKPVRIDEVKAIGRVDVVMPDSESALVSWMEGSDIKVVKVHADSTKENSIMIAASTDKRSGGFPQMTKAGDRIIFAWTDDKEKTIRTAELKL